MKHLWIVITAVLAVSCSPRVGVKLYRTMPPADPSTQVAVFGLGHYGPPDAEIIGTLKVNDSGFTTKCDYQTVVGIELGFFVGHPTMELVDRSNGKQEFDSVKVKQNK